MSNGGMGVSASDILGIPSRKKEIIEEPPFYDFKIEVTHTNGVYALVFEPQQPRKVLFWEFQPVAITHVVPLTDSFLGMEAIPFPTNADRNEMAGAIMRAVLNDDKARAAYLGSSDNSHPGHSVPVGSHLTAG